MADSPWSGISGALDQKLYQQATKTDSVVPSSPPPAAPDPEPKPVEEKDAVTKPVAKPPQKQKTTSSQST